MIFPLVHLLRSLQTTMSKLFMRQIFIQTGYWPPIVSVTLCIEGWIDSVVTKYRQKKPQIKHMCEKKLNSKTNKCMTQESDHVFGQSEQCTWRFVFALWPLRQIQRVCKFLHDLKHYFLKKYTKNGRHTHNSQTCVQGWNCSHSRSLCLFALLSRSSLS